MDEKTQDLIISLASVAHLLGGHSRLPENAEHADHVVIAVPVTMAQLKYCAALSDEAVAAMATATTSQAKPAA